MNAHYFIFLKSLCSMALLFCHVITFAQAPAIAWQKSLGGSDGDYASSIQQTIDGGYIVVGNSFSLDGDVTGNHGGRDYWIAKLDANGFITWQKSLGGSVVDIPSSIKQTTDWGYIVAGRSRSNDGDVTGNHGLDDYWIVKLDANGLIAWQKSLGGSDYEEANSIQQTADGGYIVVGTSPSNDGDVTGNHGRGDYWIAKLDANGLITWQKCLGGSDFEEANSIQQAADGGYIVAGVSYSNDGDVTGNHGRGDYWIVKLDANGLIAWQKCLGGSDFEEANSIQQTADGGYIVAGRSSSNDGDVTGNHGINDYWIVKLDVNGLITWQKCLGGSRDEWAGSIQQTADGGYIVVGTSTSIDGDVTGNHGLDDYWIVKLDANGLIAWQKNMGGTGDEGANSIQQTADGGYIVVGTSTSIDGDVTGNHGYVDYWIVKLGGTTGVITTSIFDEVRLYPNPNTGSFQLEGIQEESYPLEISVLDINAKEVYQQKYSSFEEHLSLDLQLPKGVYFIKLENEKGVTHKKFVIE